jgi:hypothetical protein
MENTSEPRRSIDELLKEISSLREDNESLRRSAYYWIYLYEAALHRANRLEVQFLQVSAN